MISPQARVAFQKSSIIINVDICVYVPENVQTDPHTTEEIREIIKTLTTPVNEAAQAVIASLLESQGLRSPEAPTVVV